MIIAAIPKFFWYQNILCFLLIYAKTTLYYYLYFTNYSFCIPFSRLDHPIFRSFSSQLTLRNIECYNIYSCSKCVLNVRERKAYVIFIYVFFSIHAWCPNYMSIHWILFYLDIIIFLIYACSNYSTCLNIYSYNL